MNNSNNLQPIYSIFDSVAGFYSPVFLAQNDGTAIRMMQQSIDLNHKSDYGLWRLGTFCPDTAEIVTETPSLILMGNSFPEKKGETS